MTKALSGILPFVFLNTSYGGEKIFIFLFAFIYYKPKPKEVWEWRGFIQVKQFANQGTAASGGNRKCAPLRLGEATFC